METGHSAMADLMIHCDPSVMEMAGTGLSEGGMRGSVMAALVLAGFVGSVSHCTMMCGPFVLTQTVSRLEGVSAVKMWEWHRLTGAVLLPYHLGRMTTYAALGAFAATMTGVLTNSASFRIAAAALLGLAAIFLLGMALPWFGRVVRLGLPKQQWPVSCFKGLTRSLFAAPTGIRGYALGLLLGFLPCGLLYGALSAAASMGTPFWGALAMAGFAFGTVPALIGVGIVGQVAGQRWRTVMVRAAPFLLGASGVILAWIAIILVI